MTINTYATLQSAVGSWLHRADLTSIIPDFITLAETRINRSLRVREMETEATITSTGSAATIALPTDFLQGKRLYHNTSPLRTLEYLSPEDFYTRYVSSTTGNPEAFTIETDNVVLGPTPGAGETFKFLYYKKPASLSTTAHALFVANPDLYLFGALVEAQPYVKDDKRFPMWEARFQQALKDMETKDDYDRHSGSVLSIRTDYQIV